MKWILIVSGCVTLLAAAQFAAPGPVLALSGLSVGDVTGLLFARHWGLMAGCFGALLIYAAFNEGVRRPIVFAAAVEKLGLVGCLLLQWGEPALQGLHAAALFDGLCVILYARWLLKTKP